jgi:hypothetical protein
MSLVYLDKELGKFLKNWLNKDLELQVSFLCM